MNKKMLGICLAAAVISTGTLGGVVASEVAGRSLLEANAEVDTTGNTYGNVRLWVTDEELLDFRENSTINNKWKMQFPVLWFHDQESSSTSEETQFVIRPTAQYANLAQNYPNTNGNGRLYWYFDISYESYETIIDNDWYLTVQVYDCAWLNGEGNDNPIETLYERGWYYIWASQTHRLDKAHDPINQVIFLWNNDSDQLDWSTGSINDSNIPNVVDASLAALALEGLYTCSSSQINGYGALETIGSTFLWNADKTPKVNGSLNGVNIEDYANNADWKNPETERLTAVNALAKYEALRLLSGLDDVPALS